MALVSGTANRPILPAGWVPVNHVSGHTFQETTIENWDYNYNPSMKKWANARDTKGNLWVWIPRFTYRTIQYADDPEIKIRFSNGINDDTTTIDGRACKKHPAFKFGNQELTGIWVAKYAAHKDLDNGGIPGFKADKVAWRSINVNDIFLNCLDLKNQLTTNAAGVDSHMMKNSEWGAPAILAKAIGNQRPDRNSDSDYKTGYGLNGVDTTGKSSTTGNMTGIFDMVGNTYEYVASYVNNGHANLNTYCKALVNAESKYKDVFPVGSTDNRPNNYNAAKGLTDGMMLHETSTAGEGTTSWKNWAGNGAYSDFPYSSGPVFQRGGYYNYRNAGLAYFYHYNGSANGNYGFRACFVVLNSAPLISGTDQDLGDKTEPFKISYQVDDTDTGDILTVVEKLNGEVIRRIDNAERNFTYNINIDSATLSSLAIGNQNTITITAMDNKGGSTIRRYTFKKVNAAPIISGVDGSIGDKNEGFTIVYQIHDPDGDSVAITEKLNGTTIKNISNAPQKVDIPIEISSETLYELPLNETNTIEIRAEDGKGGISYRRFTFRRTNTAPVISGIDEDLGDKTDPFTVSFSATDIENSQMTAKIFLDDKLKDSYPITEGQTYDFTIEKLDWLQLDNALHNIRIEVTDEDGATAIRNFNFTRVVDRLMHQFTKETDDACTQVLVTPTYKLAEGATLKVLVSNNVFDEEPTWEDATDQVLLGRHHNFLNETKTADTWGVGIKIIIERGTATEKSHLSGYGGAFK